MHEHWQLASDDSSDVIAGIDDINCCIENILSTRKGTDILRPEFGSHHYDYIDQPSDIAAPNFVREICAALERWEKRIVIEKIHIQGEAPHIKCTVFYRIKDEVNREIYKTLVPL